MTNDVVPTSAAPLPVDRQVMSAIKNRYNLNPKKEQLIFEIDGLGIVINNGNDYQEIITTLDGLKEKAGIDYTIEDTYTDRLGRIQRYTLYGSRLCKIKIANRKLFEKELKSAQTNITTSTQKEDEIIEHGDITYNLKSCELRYKNSKSTTASPENRELKFFLYLYQHKGEACHFKDIAKVVQTAGYKSMTSSDEEGESATHEELTDRDFTDEVSTLKRDFRTLMLSLGMPEKEFDKMIVRVPKLGFKLM